MLQSPQKTVLIVEDELSDRFPLERAFSHLQPEFILHFVETGQEALHYLAGQEPYSDRTKYPLPHLIILDLRLPGMSGLELLKWIRQQPQFKRLPVVSLTAFGNRDLPRAYELGINFYLLKPADADSLAEILQALSLLDDKN